ncbi:MAG: hypothetical protein IMF20_08015 [Proteobacteria bacterium]|nr:hypothetical protein [Pseudomonadota bacterium]
MEQTLSKVKNLEKFIQKHGEDAFISQTISKMLAYRVQEYKEEIKRLDKALRKFEWTVDTFPNHIHLPDRENITSQ